MHFSIPEVSQIRDINQGNYTVYHVHANGTLHCKLRFKQFYRFHELLKKQFGIYNLPYFPSKKLFTLKEVEIEERRAALEKYIQIISQDERISNSTQFNDFLLNAQQETLSIQRELVKVDVLLADNRRINCQFMSTDDSNTCKEIICRELKLPIKYTPYFSLFIAKQVLPTKCASNDDKNCDTFFTSRSNHSSFSYLIENNDKFANSSSSSSRDSKQDYKYVLIRKLTDFEAPFLSLHNMNQKTGSVYHLKLIKFYWDTDLDDKMIENEVALDLIYLQAVFDFEQRSTELNKDHYQYLESLALRQSKSEYIVFARCVKNYGMMWFEECLCDFPKLNTRCLISIHSNELTLRTLLNCDKDLIRNRKQLAFEDFILRVTRIRCWRLTTVFDIRTSNIQNNNHHNAIRKASPKNSFLGDNHENNFEYELAIEYLISKHDLRWIVIKSEQAVLLSTCLKSVIEELVLKKSKLPLYNEKANEISVNLRKNSANYYPHKNSNNNLTYKKSMEKSLSVETFLVSADKAKFTQINSSTSNSSTTSYQTNNNGNRAKIEKVRSLVQNYAFDGIKDEDL